MFTEFRLSKTKIIIYLALLLLSMPFNTILIIIKVIIIYQHF